MNFLEDFFLIESVNVDEFNRIFEYLKNDNIGFIKFVPKGNNKLVFSGKKYADNLFFEPKQNPWRCNALLALWSKSFYQKMLFIDSNPWDFEFNASQLSLFHKEKCLYVPYNDSICFHWSMKVENGIGVTQKKWLTGNVELFEKYNIEVNYETLGFLQIENNDVDYTNQKNDNIKQENRLLRRVKKIIRKVQKFFNRKFGIRINRIRTFLKYHIPFELKFLKKLLRYKTYCNNITR